LPPPDASGSGALQARDSGGRGGRRNAGLSGVQDRSPQGSSGSDRAEDPASPLQHQARLRRSQQEGNLTEVLLLIPSTILLVTLYFRAISQFKFLRRALLKLAVYPGFRIPLLRDPSPWAFLARPFRAPADLLCDALGVQVRCRLSLAVMNSPGTGYWLFAACFFCASAMMPCMYSRAS